MLGIYYLAYLISIILSYYALQSFHQVSNLRSLRSHHNPIFLHNNAVYDYPHSYLQKHADTDTEKQYADTDTAIAYMYVCRGVRYPRDKSTSRF